MTQPTNYTPANTFTSFAPSGFANLGTNLDTEFENIEQTLDEILVNLAIIQRDDTRLGNGIVTADSLASDVVQLIATTGWTPKGLWATATAYAVKDVVSQSGIGYVCVTAHTSGTFATDLAATKWIPFTTSTTMTAFGTSLVQAADATAALTLLGLTVTAFAKTFLDDADAAAVRATLGVEQILNNLTTETVLSLTDLIPMVDASESNASNKMTVQNFLSQGVSLATSVTLDGSTQGSYEIFARKVSDGSLARILPSTVGVGKQSIWIPAAAMSARTTTGAASGSVETTTNKVMLKTLDFDPTTAEFAQFQIQMPKGATEGTLTALFVWSHAATTTNFGVVWGIQALALSDTDASDTAFGTAVTVTDTGGTTNAQYRSGESGTFTPSNTWAENDVVAFQVYRDATNGSDNLAVDARLHGVVLFYTTNANTDN